MSTIINPAGTLADATSTEPPIYIDLGTRRRRLIQRLRRGEGPLAMAVEQAVSDLRAGGEIDSGARVVVVVVSERPQTMFDFMR